MWETFVPNLGTLGLCVLELLDMYATNGQTDGRTDKSNAMSPFPTVGRITDSGAGIPAVQCYALQISC